MRFYVRHAKVGRVFSTISGSFVCVCEHISRLRARSIIKPILGVTEAARGKSASSRAEKQRVVAAGPKTPTMPTLTAEQLSMLTELSSSEKLKLKKAHLPGHHQTSPSKGATNRLGKRKLMRVGGP